MSNTLQETRPIIKANKISRISLKDITISSKKINNKVKVYYTNNKPLIFQTPFLQVGSTFRDTHVAHITQFDTLFTGEDDKKIKEFYTFVEELENTITSQVSQYPNWFDGIDVTFKNLIRELDDDSGTEFMKWAIDIPNCIFVDENKNAIDHKNIGVDDYVKLIIELTGLWISQNQFGLMTSVKKILMKKYHKPILSEYVFDESDSEEENGIVSVLATENKKNKNILQKDTPTQNEFVNDEIDEVIPSAPIKPIHDQYNIFDNNYEKNVHKELPQETNGIFKHSTRKDNIFRGPFDKDELETDLIEKINNPKKKITKSSKSKKIPEIDVELVHNEQPKKDRKVKVPTKKENIISDNEFNLDSLSD